MNPDDLPTWLYGMQAVTWLVTGDVELTKRALPKGKAGSWRFPIIAISTNSEERGTRGKSAPASRRPSPKKRLKFAANPEDWGGINLSWLAIRQGDHQTPQAAIDVLVQAAKAGQSASRSATGKKLVIDAVEWIGKTLAEHPQDQCTLVIAPLSQHREQSDAALVIPLFLRDHIFELERARGAAVKAAHGKRSAAKYMYDYALKFKKSKGRPPYRDKEAVPDAVQVGYAVNQARQAYAGLPDHLKNPARKPRQSSKERF